MDTEDNLTVVNLTSKVLTNSKEAVLKLGLSFCPDKNLEYTETRIDLFKFIRKLKLHTFYKLRPKALLPKKSGPSSIATDALIGRDLSALQAMHELESIGSNTQGGGGGLKMVGISQEKCASPFKPASTFLPQMPTDYICTFAEAVTKELTKLRAKGSIGTRKQNLSQQERMALKNLRMDTNIVVKPSDKGGNVVLQTYESYYRKALRQLSDVVLHAKCTREEYMASVTRCHEVLKNWYEHGMLESEEFLYLICLNPITPSFYHIPKLHKSSVNPPGRPIVSSQGSPCEKISIYIDYFLSEFVQKLKNYIRETKDVLLHVKSWSGKKGIAWWLWTLQVCIPTLYTLRVCKQYSIF